MSAIIAITSGWGEIPRLAVILLFKQVSPQALHLEPNEGQQVWCDSIAYGYSPDGRSFLC